MSGQGRGEKAWLGDNCYVARGTEEGRSGRIERSLCLSPVPGDCESLLTGTMLKCVEGKGEDSFITKQPVALHPPTCQSPPLGTGETQTQSQVP